MIVNTGQLLSERAKVCPHTLGAVDLSTGVRKTFSELNMRSNQLVHVLRARGLAAGSRTGVLMSNGVDFVTSHFGLAKLGSIQVLLNWRLTGDELSFQLCDSGASFVMFSADQRALVAPLAWRHPGITWLQYDGEPAGGATILAPLLDAAPVTEPALGAAGDDPQLIMYTSGTTGRPKGAVHSHNSTLAWCQAALATTETRLGDRGLVLTPLFHIGSLALVLQYVYRGVTAFIAHGFDPAQVWQTIAAEGVNHTFMVPSMLNALYHHPARAALDFKSLRWIMVGAAPVPVSLIDAYAQIGIDLYQVYGSTETHGGICIIAPEFARIKAGSTGVPYFGIAVRVVDESGRDVPPGVPGEVITKGPNIIREYWNLPESTAAAFKDGWFYLGDIAEVDSDGFVYIKDRSKDIVISGGENIYPAEVEDCLLRHPAVRDVAVIGQPSARWGESVAAIIVLREPLQEGEETKIQSDLLAFCEGRLARYKQPRIFNFVPDLPRNASAKILKHVLRSNFPGPAPE